MRESEFVFKIDNIGQNWPYYEISTSWNAAGCTLISEDGKRPEISE
jgi:hypothetical protein